MSVLQALVVSHTDGTADRGVGVLASITISLAVYLCGRQLVFVVVVVVVLFCFVFVLQ